ncbi:hypothetical protein D3C73_1529240 [compost metagenome]
MLHALAHRQKGSDQHLMIRELALLHEHLQQVIQDDRIRSDRQMASMLLRRPDRNNDERMLFVHSANFFGGAHTPLSNHQHPLLFFRF